MNKLKNFTNPLLLIAYFLTLFVINFVDINLLKFDGFPMDNPYQLLLTLLTTLIFINSYNDQNLNLNLLFSPEIFFPLLALAMMSLIANFVKKKYFNKGV